MTINELDELAKKFIIGYSPLTPQQKEILENIRDLEYELQVIDIKRNRIINLLRAMYSKLAE